MKTLSVFVDESGDFGPYSKHSPYYIVSMVFHNQSIDINQNIEKLNEELNSLGFKNHVIHTEPLIRKEEDYSNLSPNERRAIFSKLYYFALKTDIRYKSFIVYKNECNNEIELEAKIAKQLSRFVKDNINTFLSYDKVILYYDNGQRQLNSILNTLFASELSNYEVRKAYQKDYRLSQVADLMCTLKSLEDKVDRKMLSKSELLLFHSYSDLKKDFIKRIKSKEIN